MTNGDLKYAAFNASSRDIQTIDSTADVREWTSIPLDAEGNPHITYYDVTNGDLKYACMIPPGDCLGDIADTSGWGDPDGKVNIGDLNALIVAMLKAYRDGDDTGLYDIDPASLPNGADCSDTTGFGDADGKVDVGDLNALLMAMLAAYPDGDPAGLYEVGCLQW